MLHHNKVTAAIWDPNMLCLHTQIEISKAHTSLSVDNPPPQAQALCRVIVGKSSSISFQLTELYLDTCTGLKLTNLID